MSDIEEKEEREDDDFPQNPRPRPRYAGDTYRVLRWTHQHFPLLRPSDTSIREIQAYCIGLASMKSGVQVHAVTYVHDHVDIIVTDPGVGPHQVPTLAVFMQIANKWVSQCTNVKLSRFDQLWGSGSYDAPRLETQEEVLAAIVDVMAAPTICGLVRYPREWEGLCIKPRDIGTTMRIAQPTVGFGKKSKYPPYVTLSIVPPPAFADMELESYRALVARGLDEREAKARARMAEENKKFRGVKRSRKLPLDKAYSSDAAIETWREAQAIDRRQSWGTLFLIRYREARGDWMYDKTVAFPKGTYWFLVNANVEIDWDEETRHQDPG